MPKKPLKIKLNGDYKLDADARKEIIKDFEAEHNEARKNQREFRRKCGKIDSYIDGLQNYDMASGKAVGWELAEAESETSNVDDESLVLNETRRKLMVDVQRLSAYSIKPNIIPESKDNKDKSGARMGKMYLSHLLRQSQEERLKLKVANLLARYNKAFLKVHWDPSAGKSVKVPSQDVWGKYFWSKETRPQGEVAWDIVSPKNMLFPKYSTDLKKVDWSEELHITSTDYVLRKYGISVKPEDVRQDDMWLVGDYGGIEKGVQQEGHRDSPEDGTQDRVVLKEKMIRPCSRYRRGAIVTWANKSILRCHPLLDLYDDIPLYDCEILHNDDKLFEDPPMWDILPVQNYINYSASMMMRWLKMIPQLRMWIHENTGINEKELVNSTAFAAKYSGDKKPEWDKVPEISRSIFEIYNLFMDKSSSLGFSNELAKVRRSLSGNALGILQEMDDTIFRPGLRSIEEMFRQGSEMSLRISSRYDTTPKLVKMSSMQGWQIEQNYRGELLNGNFNVSINLMSGLPSNKVMRLELLRSLFREGAITKEHMNANLEFGMEDEAMEAAQKQHEIAGRLVQRLLDFPAEYEEATDTQAETFLVPKAKYHDFDNAPLLKDKLQEAMQESFDEWDPPVQLAVLEFWNYYKERIVKQAQENAMAAAEATGRPLPETSSVSYGDNPLQGPDSNQNAAQQPGRGMIPSPVGPGATR